MLAMTGTSGKLGGAVAEELIQRAPAATLRLGTRSPENLAKLKAAGAAVCAADFDDASSLERLFQGCSVALVISGDAPNEHRVAQHAAAFEAARRAGVARIVYPSFASATPQSRFLVAPSHLESERMLHALGPAFPILRNNLYTENIMIEAARATGELVQPESEGRAAYISYADVARAIAGALLGSGHENRTSEITGPEALSHFDIAERLGTAWRRPIRVRDVSFGTYTDGLARRGLPPFIVELLVSLHSAIGAGEYAGISSDAAALSGASIESASTFLARA